MNANAQVEISRYLDSGESVLWAGAPRQGLVLRASDIFMIPFSLLWGGFAIFWLVGAAAAGAPPFFLAFGVPFVVIGLYMIIGRFFVDARQRAKTLYAVTDRRAMIVSGLFSRSINSLPLDSLSDVTLTEKSDRTGTITFGRPNPMGLFYPAGMQWPGMSQYQSPAFDMIDNVKVVHDHILEAKRSVT
jgi:hypothetical protein